MKRLSIALVFVAIIALFGVPVKAQEQQEDKGLLITPIRAYKTVAADKTSSGSLTVGNLTRKSIDISLSVEQFSVTDYSYDYVFSPPKEQWVEFETPFLKLAPNETREVKYRIAVPKDASPGGHYFTLFAQAQLEPGKKVRAATVLYVTVDGEITKTSTIEGAVLPDVSFGNDIPYSLTIHATGNTHFLIYASGKLEGWSVWQKTSDSAHILLPNTNRRIEGSIAAPLLPGLYKASYGYKTEEGQLVQQSKNIVYVPIWFLLILVGVIWGIIAFLQRRRRLLNFR